LGVAEHLRDDEQLAEAPPNAVAIWHRLLAYATAFGVAHRVQQLLPLGPESPTRAWSAESGRWRVVRVRYPDRWPPGWGCRPGELIKRALGVLLQVGIPCAVILTLGVKLLQADAFDGLPFWGYAVAALVSVPFLLMGLFASIQFLVGVANLFALFGPLHEVSGRAIRVRPVAGGADHWVALDDGTREEVVAYKVRIPNSISVGAYAHLRVRPITGEVKSAEVTDLTACQTLAS
jgi:hypothetical protein